MKFKLITIFVIILLLCSIGSALSNNKTDRLNVALISKDSSTWQHSVIQKQVFQLFFLQKNLK